MELLKHRLGGPSDAHNSLRSHLWPIDGQEYHYGKNGEDSRPVLHTHRLIIARRYLASEDLLTTASAAGCGP
jgi:hypothetical protein